RFDFNSQAVSSCCPKPILNFDAFRPSCGKYLQEGKPKISPCLYECIFNSCNVLDGLELNVESGRKILQDMLGSNKEFLDVYVSSLQNCTAKAEMLMKRARRNLRRNNCSTLPVLLSWCTIENAFVHCPSTSWRSSQSCEEARDFMVNCKCDEDQSVCI
ncbi:hypothetical protein KR044_009608, partial [Drosophila immigrans]